MKKIKGQILLGLALIAISAILYFMHYLIFRNARDIFFYLIHDIAFIPINVLIVTLIIERVLVVREKQILMNKLNMIIGAFYSEAGTYMLRTFSKSDPRIGAIRKELVSPNIWGGIQYSEIYKNIRNFSFAADMKPVDIEELRGFLLSKREFLLRLLENPNLLEHESFSDLLWAVFHLTEELVSRNEIKVLPATDLAHIAGDINRAYVLLVYNWFDYMKHLKSDYPYLFSLAIRQNPFDPDASPVVKQ